MPSPQKDQVQDRLARAAEVIRIEAEAIRRLEEQLDEPFSHAVELILGCDGSVVVTGMGKAGLVGQKVSATLASTGTPSFFLHPAEALHGDLGRMRPSDILVALSNSGETVEVLQALAAAKKAGARAIGVTGRVESRLGQLSDCVLDIGRVEEACPLKLAPTASTSAMMALGDALAMVVLGDRGFDREDFARFHPAGALGHRLLTVGEVMRSGEELPLVEGSLTVAEVQRAISTTPGRPGAALVVDGDGRLAGIFTDGDLRRLITEGDYQVLDQAVREHMSTSPKVLSPDQLVEEAHRLLRQFKNDQAPVLDSEGRPIGLIDVQDLLDVEA